MRLHALLSFYDEPIEALAQCIAGLATADVDHVIAVDGAYALYPDGQPASDPNQHAAIVLACRQLGMACTLHVPETTWPGNEVEKRTFMFSLAWAAAAEDDWLFVMDADQIVSRVPDDFRDRLERAHEEVAEVEIFDYAIPAGVPNMSQTFTMRCLYRAQPITVQTNHCTYVTQDGRLLWGWDQDANLVPALDLTDLRVGHHPDRRPVGRLESKMQYYAARDEAKIERGVCDCGEQAVTLVPAKWRMTHRGPVSPWIEMCEQCAIAKRKVNRRVLGQIYDRHRKWFEDHGVGLDLDSGDPQRDNQNGVAPRGMAVR